MAVAITYSLTSLECPPLQAPATILDVQDATPLGAEPWVSGATTTLLGITNRNAARLDLVGRYGGGAGAVLNGLELSEGGGLTLNISAGQGIVDTITPQDAAARTLAMTDGVFNWVWLSRGGTFSKVTGAVASPVPAVPDPATAWVFLGRVKAASGSIAEIDYSGRPSLMQGNLLLVQTADPSEPMWVPPGTLRYIHKCLASGETEPRYYLWDGTRFVQFGLTDLLAQFVLLDARVTALEDEDTARKLRATQRHLAQLDNDFIIPDLTDDLDRAFAEGAYS